MNPTNLYTLAFIHLALMLSIFPSELTAQKANKKSVQHETDTIQLTVEKGSTTMEISFVQGESHNNPTFAIWLEDMQGNLIETLMVTESFGTGIFRYGDAGNGTWMNSEGVSLRPAALPYWSHKQTSPSQDGLYIPTPDNPVPDAISRPTPTGNFIVFTEMNETLPETFNILLEINQTWDWNDYWTNNKYPLDNNYKSSAQPSVVYQATINQAESDKVFQLKAIGHGHYSGADGLLYEDLSTLSTSLNIVKEITVRINH